MGNKNDTTGMGIIEFNKRSNNMRIYVGNLSSTVNEDELRQEFLSFGEIESVSIITDKYSGRSKGFGFVEMPSVSEGQAAITGLNGKMIKERILTVNTARPRSENRSGGFYGDRRSGGGYGGGRQRRY